MFVIQILEQVLAVGVADASREPEAGVQQSVGVVAHQHGIPDVSLVVAPPQLPRQLQTGLPPSAMRPLRAVLAWGPQDTHCWVTWALHTYIHTYIYTHLHTYIRTYIGT